MSRKGFSLKRFLLLLMISSISVVFVLGEVIPQGWWDIYQYTVDISGGTCYYRRCKHEGAINAYAYIVSSTGSVDFDYLWDYPYLHVWITNRNSYMVTVNWKACFYVN